MAEIRHNAHASKAILLAAKKYGEEHNLGIAEMGLAVVVTGMAMLSEKLNNVQMGELLRQVFELTAPVRKRNSS